MKNKKATKKDLEDVKLIDLFLIRKNNKLDYLKYKNKIKIRRFFRYAVYYFKLPLKILLVKLQLIKK